MPSHDSVPRELYEAAIEQLTQALQAIAALAHLTDEEVRECRRAHGESQSDPRGWAAAMRADMLSPGKYGREALLDMLRRHEFLTNSHAGFIYGAFEGPQLTYTLGEHAQSLADRIESYARGAGPTVDPAAMRATFSEDLRAGGASEADITYLLRVMGARIPYAALVRMWRIA
jgi:hypothetical protein